MSSAFDADVTHGFGDSIIDILQRRLGNHWQGANAQALREIR
jgi:hypothetical protein